MTYAESYRCKDCGEHHYLDCSLPSEIWNQIADEGTALCAKCIDKRLTEKELTSTCRFYFVGEALIGDAYGTGNAALRAERDNALYWKKVADESGERRWQGWQEAQERAKIAETENAVLRAQVEALESQRAKWVIAPPTVTAVDRAEHAEAEIAALKAELDQNRYERHLLANGIDQWQSRAEQAEAERDRLRREKLEMESRPYWLIECIDEGNGGGQTGKLVPANDAATKLGPVYRDYRLEHVESENAALRSRGEALERAIREALGWIGAYGYVYFHDSHEGDQAKKAWEALKSIDGGIATQESAVHEHVWVRFHNPLDTSHYSDYRQCKTCGLSEKKIAGNPGWEDAPDER